ncbi:MAG: cellulase family glycosylhydrolase [Solirubrobacterales bacterium]
MTSTHPGGNPRRRPGRRWLLAFALGAVVLVATAGAVVAGRGGGGGTPDREAAGPAATPDAGTTTGTPDDPADGAPRRRAVRGVQGHLLWEAVDGAERRRRLDAIRDAGAELVRVDVGWSDLEAEGRGRWDADGLAAIDALLTEAAARDLEVLLTLWQTPCWASSAPENRKQSCQGAWWERDVQRYPPRDAAEYGRAARFLAGRYAGRVAAWELWNEPNAEDSLGGPGKAAAYTAMVKAAYRPIKRVDPNTKVLAGALALADVEFTRQLIDEGIGDQLDGFSVHPYAGSRPATDRQRRDDSFAYAVPAVHRALVNAGIDAPVWLTEIGWSSCDRGTAEGDQCVDEDTQAERLRGAYRLLDRWDWVESAVWYRLRDGDTGERIDNYGLQNPDGSPKPAFDAFKAAAER